MKPGVNTVEFSDYVQSIVGNRLPRRNSYRNGSWGKTVHDVRGDDVHHINHLIPSAISSLIVSHIKHFDWLPVGIDGFANKEYSEVGNYRLSNFNPEMANAIWQQITDKGWFTDKMAFDKFSSDCGDHSIWKPIGLNPLFRYIRYDARGKLVTHYDAPYIQDENIRSLMSVVIYLTSNTRGATRFIDDEQGFEFVENKDLSDWDRCARDDEVLLRINPKAGDAVIFNHRLLHDSEPLENDDPEKIIIRTDIMFEKA